MNQTVPSNPNRPIPVIPPASLARLHWFVLMTVTAAAIATAILIRIVNRPEWWNALLASTIVTILASIASIFVLRLIGGKTVDFAINIFMGASAVRLVVAVLGCIIAVKGMNCPAEPTAFMICGFYIAILFMESMILARALKVIDQR